MGKRSHAELADRVMGNMLGPERYPVFEQAERRFGRVVVAVVSLEENRITMRQRQGDKVRMAEFGLNLSVVDRYFDFDDARIAPNNEYHQTSTNRQEGVM